MLTILLSACYPVDNPSDKANDSGGTNAAACEAIAPTCIDNMILDLSLHDDKVSDGAVETTTEGDDFVTTIDASAGGYSKASKNPWVYVSFQSDGAHRIDIDDESALEDMTWDLSLRRFIVRLNGGDSGPSCVGGAAVKNKTYAELTSIPDGVKYATDDYYTDDCTLINDSSGIEGSPQVVLGPWWEYPGCVKTTEIPFLIQNAEGRVLKLVVEGYYSGDGQAECNSSDATSADGGYFTIRWRWMD